jgi:hypothetical protein
MARKAKNSASSQTSDGIPSPTAGASVRVKKPPLTDAERHKRFVAMAKEVGASKDTKDFDAAFMGITAPPKSSA